MAPTGWNDVPRLRSGRGREASEPSPPRRGHPLRPLKNPRFQFVRGRPGTGARSNAVIASLESGSRKSEVKFRFLAPHVGWRSASSGRPRVRMKIGWSRDQSRRYSMNSRRALSAHWMSSKTVLWSRCWTVSRSTNATPKRDSPGRRIPDPRDRANERVEARRTVARQDLAGASPDFDAALRERTSIPSSLTIPARMRTISASAQNADAISVRETASAMPPDDVDQPVDVLLEFP